VSSPGGDTFMKNGTKMSSNQASGAYLFRPINQTTTAIGKATISVTQGPLITEVSQTFSNWATHVIRLKKGSPFIEVEWTAGPIPLGIEEIAPKPAPGNCQGWKQTKKCNAHGAPDPQHNENCSFPLKKVGMSGYCECGHGVQVFGDGCGGPAGFKTCEDACNAPIPQYSEMQGREVVLKFSTGIESASTFYTDSNGREMVKRVRDGRGPSYPPLVVNEPVAENYYPVNSMISLDDTKVSMAVVTDVSMGGSSMNDGQLELMVHRRVQHDDHRGVQEPLNETMCGCNDIGAAPGSMGAHGHEGDGGCDCAGLTMRGVSYVIIDTVANANEQRRKLIETLNFPPTLAFSKDSSAAYSSDTATYTALSAELPENIKLMTLTSNYGSFLDGQVLLRLAHMYSVDEHPTLSQPVTVDLQKVFGKAGLKIAAASETTLTGNQPKEAQVAKRHDWRSNIEDPTGGKMYQSANPFEERVPFDAANLVTTIRPMELKTFLVTFK